MTPRLYVIEGPDCSGKTTLAKFLARHVSQSHECAYFHCEGKSALFPAMNEVMDMVLNNAEWCFHGLGMSYVIDRHWPSEYVYGSITRPEMAKNFRHEHFKERIQRLGGMYVYCRGGEDALVKRHHEQRDEAHPYDDDLFRKIINKYEEWYFKYIDKLEPNVEYVIEEHGSDLKKFCDKFISI